MDVNSSILRGWQQIQLRNGQLTSDVDVADRCQSAVGR